MVAYDEIAERLRRAYTGGAIPPLRDGLSPTDIDGAYAVQTINIDYWQRNGRRLVGRKVGLTAKAVQAQLGVDRPDFGALFADMQVPDGGTLDPAAVIQPKAEVEIAFVMRRGIDDPAVSRDAVAAAIDHAVCAIEIVDSRIADWRITFADTVADNGSSAFFVLGGDRHPLKALDLYACGMVMERNGEVASLGAGAACLGHPLNAVQWLARTLAERGTGLRDGDIVLSGALGPMVAFKPGDRIHAQIGGLGSCRFSCGGQS